MSAGSIVIPGGFSSIAVRNAARLYEPARKLPQMARTLIPFASLTHPLLCCRRPLNPPSECGQGGYPTVVVSTDEPSRRGAVAPAARIAVGALPLPPPRRSRSTAAAGRRRGDGYPARNLCGDELASKHFQRLKPKALRR